MSSRAFDLVVIGTGSAGAAPAYRCRKEGWRVAVVDQLPYGGTCALRGCDPKKVLVGAAELVAWADRMRAHAVSGELRIEWPDLMRFKRSFSDHVPEDREERLRRAGIETCHGRARFSAPDRIEVEGETLEADHVVLAVGARPRPLGIPGEQLLATSTDFLDLERLPARVAFVGAGYVSFELAHVARRAGAEVTILGRGRPLAAFDPVLVERLVEHTKDLGVEIHLGADVVALERAHGGRVTLRAETDDGELEVTADLAVHGGGRVPATADLALESGDVETDPDGAIRVNEYLQSVSNPRVYAAGDAVSLPGSAPLTPVAGYEGGIVASNLLSARSRTPDYDGVPSVVFTVPPLARVGLGEEEARARGHDIEVRAADTSDWYTSHRVREECAGYRTIVDREGGRILGAHLLGPHAEEVINLFALAIRQGLDADALRHQLYAYPTAGSDIPYMV